MNGARALLATMGILLLVNASSPAEAGSLPAAVHVSPSPQIVPPGASAVVQVRVTSDHPQTWTLEVANENALVVGTLPPNTTVLADRHQPGLVTMSIRASPNAPVGTTHEVTVVATTTLGRTDHSIHAVANVTIVDAPRDAERRADLFDQIHADSEVPRRIATSHRASSATIPARAPTTWTPPRQDAPLGPAPASHDDAPTPHDAGQARTREPSCGTACAHDAARPHDGPAPPRPGPGTSQAPRPESHVREGTRGE